MQVVITGLFVVGITTQNLSVVVNALLGLGVTLLPAAFERDYGVPLDPWLTFWITLAVLLHTVGMLGPYDTVWWWDHLTHGLSASVVAAVGYAATRAVDDHWDEIYLPPDFMFVYVLLFTLAAGVLWEVLEFVAHQLAIAFGYEAVLIQYSLTDTVIDLIFDVAGAILVALVGTPHLAGLVLAFRRIIDEETA